MRGRTARAFGNYASIAELPRRTARGRKARAAGRWYDDLKSLAVPLREACSAAGPAGGRVDVVTSMPELAVRKTLLERAALRARRA